MWNPRGRASLFFVLSSTSWACGAPGPDPIPSPDWRQVPVSIELRLAQSSPAPGLIAAVVYGGGDTVYLNSKVELPSIQISRAEAQDQPNGLAINLWHTEEGRDQWKRLQAEHVGEHLAVLVNSVVVAPPAIIAGVPKDMVDAEYAPDTPLTVMVPLPREQAKDLAQAVSQTWPAAAAP